MTSSHHIHVQYESQYSFFVFMIQLLNEVGSAKCKAELCPPAPLAVTVSTQKQSQTTPTPGRTKGKVNSNCLRQRRQAFAHKVWWAPVGFEGTHTTITSNCPRSHPFLIFRHLNSRSSKCPFHSNN